MVVVVDEIRAVYAADRGRNCIDGSDSVEGAKEELSRWFNMVEIQCYTRAPSTSRSPLERPFSSWWRASVFSVLAEVRSFWRLLSRT